jgi:hypothetical protein
MVQRFKPIGIIHLRGMYYIILASGDVLLPDGSRFKGTTSTARLIENAGKHARHLGLIPFDRIVDERAAPPNSTIPRATSRTPPIHIRSSVA